jgi:hypothetical protein
MFGQLGIAVTAVVFLAVPAPIASASASAITSAQGGCLLPTFGPGESYHPKLDRRSFTPRVTNRYFPLRPGRISVYTGVKDGKRAVNVVAPSSRTRVVDGVRTRVVEDRLYLNGELEERTSDYYAQDRCGNVWYFGEDTAELDSHGKVVSTEGSFHAGVDGAQPGVYMPARPRVGQTFRQEWYKGQAEDVFTVLDVDASVTVPYGSFRHALRTKETTALEPDVVDNKLYVRRIGQVVEKAVRGPAEALQLVEVIDTY